MEEKEVIQSAGQEAEEKQTENVDIVPEDAQYKVYGCDICTTDPVTQKYYQATMDIMVKANLLIGDFDKKGNYIISKELKRDVVVMNKEIEEQGENFFKAASLYMKKNFYFYVSISQLPENKAKAKLFLYEYVGDFLEKDFVISHIANFIDVFDENFIGKVRKAFNLVDVGAQNNDLATPNLAIRLQQMLDEQVRANDLYETACQMFVLRLLKCLENNVKGRQVIAEYKKLLAKHKGTLSFKKQKALLDKVINRLGGYEYLLKDNPEGQMMLEQFLREYNEIQAAKEAKATQEGEKKSADKPKAASSKGGKAAGKKPDAKKDGGGSKKKSKKKDDKGGKKEEKKKSSGSLSKIEIQKIIDKVKKEYEEARRKRAAREKPQAEQPQTPQAQQSTQKPKEEDAKKRELDEFDMLLEGHTLEQSIPQAQAGDPVLDTKAEHKKQEEVVQGGEGQLTASSVEPEQKRNAEDVEVKDATEAREYEEAIEMH